MHEQGLGEDVGVHLESAQLGVGVQDIRLNGGAIIGLGWLPVTQGSTSRASTPPHVAEIVP